MLEIDHIGYAVKNIEEAMEQMRLLGYSFGKEIKDEGRKVWIAFGNFKGYRVELVAPAAEGSPVDNILKYVGASPYHICYCSDDFDYDLKVLCGGGYKVAVPPAPAAALEGRQVVFLYALAVGLVEILEK